jgi:hypothetical protein
MAIEFFRRWWPWMALASAALALLLAGPAACKRAARLAAEQRVATEQQRSAASSARDAIETIGTSNLRERQSDELSTENEREIHNAKGANQPVDPAVARAGLDSLCRRAVYRDSERCRLRRAASR